MKVINIAEEFSKIPGGRIPEDGPNSGQEFRIKFLIPNLEANEDIIIKLDGTRGYSSCFLEEVFGGLVRCGYGKDYLCQQLSFISKRPGLIEEIKGYIIKADQNKYKGY